SDECFRLAGMWLDECLEQNELESETSSSFMPTRTIDVGAADGSEDPRLAVHDTDGPVTRNGWPQRLPWLTLTHCWGGSSPLMLTHDTLAEWTASGIPMPLLPLTFRDAVSITRRLGYRHLWIDSICIVQDSRQDWEREAARMGDVYRHGVLNISASSGRGCRDGIFGKRGSSTTPALAAVRLPFNSKRLGIGGEWLYLRAGRWDNYLEYITGRQHNTLASRGWVLQESLLSPRTLHFASQQLFWECTHATYAEGRIDALALPDNKMTALQAPHVYSYKMMLPSVLHWPAGTAADAAARDEMHSLWLRVVENYSSRALTVPSDVFPALAGVASVFQARLGDRYLAGLFRRHLLEGFVWRSIDPARSTLRPQSDACSAPSWSWASLIGG
ncbi:heterokaryon incompatibility protein-domain-containing protein, partial [Lasiosphaeria miniovina]